MSRQEIHISTPFIPKGYLLWGLLLLTILGPAFLPAQEQFVSEHRLAFFEDRAWEDAAYEQDMPSMSEEDELDFWTDQRNFESSLQTYYWEGYQVYLSAKRAAYMKHKKVCNAQCGHGDYYQLQAAFYFQSGDPGNSSNIYIATSTAH